MSICVCAPNSTDCRCNATPKRQTIAWIENNELVWDLKPIVLNAKQAENKRIRDLLTSSDLDLANLSLSDLLALIKLPEVTK